MSAVEFVEPGAWASRRRTGRSEEREAKRRAAHGGDEDRGDANRTKRGAPEWTAAAFESAKREVLELGRSGLSHRDRKRLEEERLRSLGFATPKPSAPRRVREGMLRKQRKRDATKAAHDREAGVLSPATAAAAAAAAGRAKAGTGKKRTPVGSSTAAGREHGRGGLPRGGGARTGVYRIRDVTKG